MASESFSASRSRSAYLDTPALFNMGHPPCQRALELSTVRDPTTRSEHSEDVDAESFANEFDSVAVEPEAIGRGTFGEVYKAFYLERPHDPVALKVPTDHERAVQLLLDEAAFLRSFVHPNIVKFLDIVKSRSGRPALAMEYATGGSLAARLRRDTRLNAKDAARVFCGVLEALEYVHLNKVLHLDIK